MSKQVTEQDFRLPEFKDAKPEDYEFRKDGVLVRKDRWEQGMVSIASALGFNVREFEIPDVISRARELKNLDQTVNIKDGVYLDEFRRIANNLLMFEARLNYDASTNTFDDNQVNDFWVIWQAAIKLQSDIASNLQAKIDTLMLEHCPDEMTQEQKDNRASHQKPAKPKL